jgi:hypothetical protein
MKALFITLAFTASGIMGFSQGTMLGPGQSYVFEFTSLPYSRPATQSDNGSIAAYFAPGTFSDGESVEFAIYANSLADTPRIGTYTHSGPADPLAGYGFAFSWFNTDPPYFPDLQGLYRVTMLTGDAELSWFSVKQVVNGGVYSGYFPVPEPSPAALLGLGLVWFTWFRRRARRTNLSLHWTGSSRLSLFQWERRWRLLPASELRR